MKGIRVRRSLFIGIAYSFIHFSVEVASFYLLFSRISTNDYSWLFALSFDALAFIPQSIFGIVSDKYPKLNLGAIGCLVMISSLIIKNDVISLILLATGNALVHVDGAQHTLRGTNGKITPNAVFVGGGSFGVITGQLLGKSGIASGLWISVLFLVISGVITCFVRNKNHALQQPAQFSITTDKSIGFIVLCAFIGVVVRGYIGYAIPTEWNKTAIQAVALFVFM